MSPFILYILLSASCLSIFYAGYLVLFRDETRFSHLRSFLLVSMILSIIIPFSPAKIHIDFTAPSKEKTVNALPFEVGTKVSSGNLSSTTSTNLHARASGPFNLSGMLMLIYFSGLFVFSLRLLAHLIRILHLYSSSVKIPTDKNTLVVSFNINTPFSFFRWIFIPHKIWERQEGKEVVTHENIHASQFHSLDILLIEILSVFMWFNPLVWMMRKSIQLVHEYLADEGVLDTGIDKFRYQALLINQVAEDRLICLSSTFNHSLIQKRMNMMTQSKMGKKSRFGILALIPLAVFLLFAVSCVHSREDNNTITAVEPVKMNVLYIGVNNPIKIAISGYERSDIAVTIDNGVIEGENGEYIIRPKQAGTAVVTVSAKGKEMQKTTFRVKYVPDPQAAVTCKGEIKTGGDITKQELLDAGGITAFMRDFDFDIDFKVISFDLSAPVPGSTTVRKESSNIDKFSPKQKELINTLSKNTQIIIDNIVCMGPDGAKRKLNAMVFSVTE